MQILWWCVGKSRWTGQSPVIPVTLQPWVRLRFAFCAVLDSQFFFYSKCFRQNNSWNGRVKSVKSNSSSLWVHESSSHFKHMLWVQMRLCNAVYRRHLRRDHLSQVFGLCKIWKFGQISKKNFGCLHNTWNSQMIKVNSSNTIQIRMTDAISPEDEICIYRTDAGLKLDYPFSVQTELLHPIMAFSSAAAENTPTVGLQAAAATPSSATSSALLVQLQHLPGAPRLWQSVSWCVCVCVGALFAPADVMICIWKTIKGDKAIKEVEVIIWLAVTKQYSNTSLFCFFTNSFICKESLWNHDFPPSLWFIR